MWLSKQLNLVELDISTHPLKLKCEAFDIRFCFGRCPAFGVRFYSAFGVGISVEVLVPPPPSAWNEIKKMQKLAPTYIIGCKILNILTYDAIRKRCHAKSIQVYHKSQEYSQS